jgi:exonuclease III
MMLSPCLYLQVLLEGRTITVEYEGFYVVATYVPNSGDKLQRLEFRTQVRPSTLNPQPSTLNSGDKLQRLEFRTQVRPSTLNPQP